LSRITLWRINNGYEEDASNQAATILTNSLQKRKLVSMVKKDKNRSLLHKIAGSIEA
jgi:hypothetical protein